MGIGPERDDGSTEDHGMGYGDSNLFGIKVRIFIPYHTLGRASKLGVVTIMSLNLAFPAEIIYSM